MNKWSGVIFLFTGLLACQDGQKREEPVPATADSTTKAVPEPVERQQWPTDTLVLVRSKAILSALRQKDYTKLVSFFHPLWGVRFSPYAHIDSGLDRRLDASQFLREIKDSSKKQQWGFHDDSGDPILLSTSGYLAKFVFDVDFSKPEVFSLNASKANGNSINNLSLIYPDSRFTESYFSGFDKKYGGMDWRALRLVFQLWEGEPYLVAIIHDQWTI